MAEAIDPATTIAGKVVAMDAFLSIVRDGLASVGLLVIIATIIGLLAAHRAISGRRPRKHFFRITH